MNGLMLFPHYLCSNICNNYVFILWSLDSFSQHYAYKNKVLMQFSLNKTVKLTSNVAELYDWEKRNCQS